MDYHDLHKLTVVKLREMAKEYDDLEGVTGMTKDTLCDVLADKMGIEKPHKVVVGIDKASIKREIRALKKVREEALAARDRQKLHDTRRQLHRLRHKLHKASKLAG